MKKKTNIQKDIESRKTIANELPPVITRDLIIEPNINQENAQSEIVQEQEIDQGTAVPEKKTKRGRTTKGDEQEV